MQIKKVCIQVLGRGICSKSTFLNESASSKLRHWWLIFNNYKLHHFCFLSDLYWMKFLLHLMKKDLFVSGFLKKSIFQFTHKLDDQVAVSQNAMYTQILDHKHTNGFMTFFSNLLLNIKHLFYVTTQSTGYI